MTGLTDAGGVCQELSWGTGDELLERRFPGGAVERYDYDEAMRLKTHEFASAYNDTVFGKRFEYDERDNFSVREDLDLGRSVFSYDAINRVTAVELNGRTTESYQYDASGTLLQTQRGPRSVTHGGRVQTDGTRQYGYATDGCITAIDDVGLEHRDLRYDVDGKLVSVTLQNGQEVRYAYDPLGRRIFKEGNGERVEFVWNSCDLAAELRSGAAPVMYGSPLP